MKKILVLGSLNIDLVQQIPRLAVPGETLRGNNLQMFAGGKGANQACAAARVGEATVQMAGMVGNDVFATRLLQELDQAGVNAQWVRPSKAPSGTATIFVLPNGENTIVLSAGANAEVSPELALQAVETLHGGDLLLCQLEIPLPTVEAALGEARKRKVVTILDPAPAYPLTDSLLSVVDILTPNQTEAALLVDSPAPLHTTEAIDAAARRLHACGAQTVIIKLGAEGCLVLENGRTTIVAAFPVDVVDTTAAGDTFNGALAVALSEEQTLEEAVRFANAAAALSVTKAGAFSSIPHRAAVEKLLAASGKTSGSPDVHRS